MKKLQPRWSFLFGIIICLNFQAAAQQLDQQCPTVYEQLVDLNKYWAGKKVGSDILMQRICFEKHTDLIQLHLSLVEQHLRQKDVSDLSLGQQLKRKLGLNILRAYWKEGQFPINNHHPGQVVPYFIDDFGTACAVGHIVRETGFEDFAEKVKQENNYAYIEDMDYPELTAWAGEYGFEEEELRWVQPGYTPSVRFEEEYVEPTCGNSDGSIIVYVIGSFTSFDTLENAFFTWYQGDEPSGQPISYAKSLTNVPAGEYTLLVDAPNQNATYILPAFKTFRLCNADGPSISAMITAESCENEQDGAISIDITSGTAPHNVQLFNLLSGFNFGAGSHNRPENFIGSGTSYTGLKGDVWANSNYRAEIIDADGCITYKEIDLATNRISVGASSWNNGIIFPDCGLENGSINVSVFDEGLAGGLEYNWNTGDTGPSIQGIEAGEYAVTVVDDWGCQISEEFTISNSDGPTLDFSNVTSIPTSCPGVSDGQIQINFVDGVPPYSIKWYRNEGGLFAAPVWAFKGDGTAFTPNYTITGLAGDSNNPDGPIAPPDPTYKVVVEDGEGCRSSYELTLQEASVFGLYDVEVFNNTSCSVPNGSIVLSSISCIPNGCAEVRWEDGVVGGSRSNLATGSYGYAIINACSGDTLVSTSAYVGGENVSISSVEAGYASCGASNGWAEVLLNTNEDFDFDWSHSATLNNSMAENLAPGDYQVTVTGENGCSVVRSFTIYELSGVIFNDASTQISNPASPGAADGSIKVEASSGDGTISYSWSHNASLNANQALNLSPGQYSITATSDGGCSDVITLTLSASSCTVTPDDFLCQPWVQNYLNTNYPCNDGQCGSINLYTSPQGECVVDFVGEQPCLLAVCPSHEVFDLDGNLLESYASECGLEDLGYTNRQQVWSCGQALPGCNDNVSYTLYPELPQTSVCTGESVCIPITVENFTSIIGSSIGLGWNPNVLSFATVENINAEVTGLDVNDFDLSNISSGILNIVWESVPCNQAGLGTGITLDDCAGSCRPTLFEVCFTVVGGDGQSTSFDLLPNSHTYKDGIGCIEIPIGIQGETLEACGEGTICPVDAQEVLCLDWLQQSPLGEEGISYNEQEEIIILINLATGGGFWYSFFDCSGQLLHECAGNNINDPTVNCNSYYNSLVQNAIELLGPLEPLPDCASPPWNPQACASGNTHFINVIYEDLESEIGGQPLQEGDWLGLFYEQDDGTLVCMDQAQFTDPAQENGFQLRGCEESSPGADDGFAADEPFQFKVFKDGVEYDAGTLSVTFWGEGEIIPPVFPDATSRFLGDGRQSAIRTIRDFPDIEDPSCDTPIPISCGQSHSGNNTDGTDNALSYNCFTNVVDGPEVIYAFTLDQTEDVLITLNGLSDDLELLLLDECDRDHCIAVSERTGASSETILYEDLAPGEYIIVVEGYIGFESDYTLSLDCGDFPQGGFSCTPEEISCDETINSTTADGCSDVNFYNCSDSYTPGREKVYRIRFSQPENVRITLTPQGGDLELFLLDALDPNRCIYFSTESGDEIERILLDDNEIIPNRDYYIVVDEYGGDAGINFQLQVECVPDGPPCPWCPPPPGFCDNAEEITCGMAVNGHTQNGDSRVEKWGDCPSFNVGPELIYAFNNPVTQDVQINLSGFSENLNFYVLRDQCAVSACYEGWAGNKSGLINESILITPMPAGQYYIVVDSYDAASAFTLEVKCQETDNCFELDVPAGYSYISSNRRPGDPTIENVVPPGQFQGVSLILSDEWGNIYDPNFPTPGAPNRIGNWETTDGYRIDVSETVTLEFCGEEADPEASRAVIAQTTTDQIHNNIIGYPFQEPLTVEEAFAGSPTEGLSSIEYRYPNGSQASESYIFSLQLGTNFTMSPGNGYLLKVAQDGAFSFRGPEGGSTFMPNGCTYFRTPMRNTMERAFIRVPIPSVSGTMEAGDELGLFNENGLLCGSGKYLGEQFIITLLGDENATAASEGFVPGEMMYARIWSASTGKTREVSLQFSESEAVYADNQIYQLGGLSGISSTQSYAPLTCQLYPNPAGERLYLEYQLPDAQAISVRLIAANGQVQAQYEWNLEAGVNQNSIDLSQLPGGIYFVQLATDGATETRKIVVQH